MFRPTNNNISTGNSSSVQTFEAFFEHWLINQEHYLQELVRVIECNGRNNHEEKDVDQCKNLIEQVTDHYYVYYEAKARVARENVFLVFTPTWFSSFERSYLWIGGFRPGLAFRLVIKNVSNLTQDQSQRINTLMAQIKEEEKQLTEELNRVQEGMASPSMVELARNFGRPHNGGETHMESAIDSLTVSMESLLECADNLRRKTIIKLIEILKPTQTVEFLAATAHLQLRIRRWGMQRDTLNQRGNANGSLSDV